MIHNVMKIAIPSDLTNDELVAEIRRLSGTEREACARLIAHLAELDARELYVPAGYSSLFVYCHEGLGYSEDAAYNRKAAAQVARRYPVVVDMLADGRLSLTAVRLLAPVLNDGNHEAAFAEATGKPKREVEKLVARLEPRPDVPSTIRKLPTPTAAVPERENVGELPSPAKGDAAAGDPMPGAPPTVPPAGARKRPEVAPLAPSRYRVQFTIGEETEKKLRRIQELLKREIPDGDPAAIFDRALTVLLEKVESRKHGLGPKPRTGGTVKPGSRHTPAAVRREVVQRDDGRCGFVASDGRRCTERAYLEYHHARVPYAHGGEATVENIRLHCRAHNAHEATMTFGDRAVPERRGAQAP
jgi:hypothetical protein